MVKESTSDTELLQQIKNSDMEAFGVLFKRYQPVIFRHVWFQIHQKDLAHDIVQEAFIRIWEHRTSLQPQLNLLAYALRISTNLVLDAYKHKRVREQLKEYIPPINLSEGDNPAEALHLTLLQEQITEIINNSLGKRCREIFLLSRVEGKSHQEIADLLNISIRTVENQILHALKVLRRKLGRVD